MFPPGVPEAFVREQGCTETEWLRALPGAVGGHALQRTSPGQARVAIDDGWLHLQWTALPPRRIALISVPRMRVEFLFEGVPAPARQRFMNHFDLYMQRGGG
jgi:hypothetical protein